MKPEMTSETSVETLIIGAGLIGSSVAMHLAQQGMSDIRVLDFDLDGSLSSSELNAGGVRATWKEPVNMSMAMHSIGYFESIAQEVGFRPCGYLWLQPEERMATAQALAQKQSDAGWPVATLTLKEFSEQYPFLDKHGGLGGATFSRKDGLINPNLLKNHYRDVGRKLGVIYDDRTLVRAFKMSGSSSSILAVAERFESVMSHETRLEVLTEGDSAAPVQARPQRTKVEYRAKRVVNCAGPWASQVAKMLGYSSPVYPVRRQVSIFDCRDFDLSPYGMIVDTSGVYFHPEASHGLAGFATREPKGISYRYDGESFFQECIWTPLYERATVFEALKHLTGWAGLYEVSPDECAVIGSVKMSGTHQVFEAHSFSGHGVMHSYTAGLCLAEKIVQGRYETMDVSILSADRFVRGTTLSEGLVI